MLNVRVPTNKPPIFYLDWDFILFSIVNPLLFFQLLGFDELSSINVNKLNKIFLSVYQLNKQSIFINYPNQFGIHSVQRNIKEKMHNTLTLEDELKQFESTIFNETLGIKFDFVRDNKLPLYSTVNFSNRKIISSLHKAFRIRCFLKQPKTNKEDVIIGLILHEKLVTSLKIKT